MLSAPLDLVEVNPDAPPDAVVIWLHGLGADGHDFEPIVPQLQLPSEPPLRFVFPHAPEMAVTAFGGQRVRAWFDFDPGGGFDSKGLQRSVRQVRDLVQNEIDDGVPSNRIVLAGFSQGGAVALHTALSFTKPLAGLLALSTFLPEPQQVPGSVAGVNAEIPVFMAHGQFDPVLPIAMGEAARDRLQAAGHTVEWHDYPMGHEVCLAEIRDIGSWFERVLDR